MDYNEMLEELRKVRLRLQLLEEEIRLGNETMSNIAIQVLKKKVSELPDVITF